MIDLETHKFSKVVISHHNRNGVFEVLDDIKGAFFSAEAMGWKEIRLQPAENKEGALEIQIVGWREFTPAEKEEHRKHLETYKQMRRAKYLELHEEFKKENLHGKN